LTSFRDAGNQERFVGDNDLPPGIPRPSRIHGTGAEKTNRLSQLLLQVRKFTKSAGSAAETAVVKQENRYIVLPMRHPALPELKNRIAILKD
jgi:hypothetical protein